MARRLDSILYRRINTVVAAVVAVTLVLLLSMALIAILFAAHIRRQQDDYTQRLAALDERIREMQDDLAAQQRWIEQRQGIPATRTAAATTRRGPAAAPAAPVLLTLTEMGDIAKWVHAERPVADGEADRRVRMLLDRAVVRLGEIDAAGGEVHQDTLVLLASANLIRNEPGAALVLLRRAFDEGPATADLHGLLAAVQQQAGRPKAAIDALRDALKLEPESLDRRLHLAALLLTDQQPAEAGKVLAAVRPDRLDAKQKHGFAHMLVMAGIPDGAAALFEELTEADPSNAAAWRGLGEAALRRKEHAKAIRAFERASAAGEKSAELHYYWGLALLAEKKPAEAETQLAEAAKIWPAWADAWWALGAVLAQQEKHAAAVDAFGNCIAADADHPRAWLNLAMSLVAIGKIQDAVDTLEDDLRVHPDSAGGHLLLARLYAQTQQIADVRRTLSIALRLEPALRDEAARSSVFTTLTDPKIRTLLGLPAATQPATRTDSP